MRKTRTRLPAGLLQIAWLALACVGPTLVFAPLPAFASSLRRTAIVEAVEKVRNAVVNIQGRKLIRAESADAGSGEPFRQVNGMGTGVVIDARGYILTNFHVVENVETIQVTLADRRSFIARLVSNDAVMDLAVIKIDAGDSLAVMPCGVSSDLMPGEPVIALGNAFGYEHTVTRGIISALHREVQVSATQKYHDLIQTDASINPGNSGGPLLNIDGEMIGINVAVRVGAQGIGFAIPVDEVLEVAAQLVSLEQVEHVVHGVLGETRCAESERYFAVTGVREGSGAASSGLQPGDVITAVDQTPVNRAIDFERALLGRPTGQSLMVSVRRDGQAQTLELVLPSASLAADALEQRTWRTLGMKLTPASKEECQRSTSRYRGGMRVQTVRPDSPAGRQGIRAGDILVGMHVWETISKDNVQYVLDRDDFDSFQPLKFFILRGGETLYGFMQVRQDAVAQVPRTTERN
jgi:serine protease Do